MAEKLSHEEFVKLAIVSLRSGRYKGIHTVFSGFNDAFKTYFKGEDPVKITNEFSEQGIIALRPVKGGVVIYLPGDLPAAMSKGEQALKKMGLM